MVAPRHNVDDRERFVFGGYTPEPPPPPRRLILHVKSEYVRNPAYREAMHLIFSEMIVLRSEYIYISDAFEYAAEGWLGAPTQPGAQIPHCWLWIELGENGTFDFGLN